MKKIIKKIIPKKIINFINKIVTLIIIKIYKLKYKNLIISFELINHILSQKHREST